MIYRLTMNNGDGDYDVPHEIVVRAADETSARAIAADEVNRDPCGPHFKWRQIFLDPARSTCTPVEANGPDAVICVAVVNG